MSTKSTIAHGDNFHFYHEAADDDHVYLELEGVEFEAGHERVMVSIPIHIWETIRPLAGARLELVNHADEDLLAMVEADVESASPGDKSCCAQIRIARDSPVSPDYSYTAERMNRVKRGIV